VGKVENVTKIIPLTGAIFLDSLDLTVERYIAKC
jgi:hypothetical protein